MSNHNATVVNLRRDPYDVYIGRSRKGQPPSKWGNPFVVGQPVPERLCRALRDDGAARVLDHNVALSREQAIDLYRAWLLVRLTTGDLSPTDFQQLRGMRLGCFCKPAACHGDVIAELVDWFIRHPTATHGPDLGTVVV